MFTEPSIAWGRSSAQLIVRAQRRCSSTRMAGICELRGRMPEASLVSVVEDDRFFRESMRRLMRSLGFAVEAFSSAADFLASPRLAETACLIADVHMPAMTGLELHRQLIKAGYAIPTILITGYPNDVDRARALNDGVACYLRKPVDESHLIRCLRAAVRSAELPEQDS
jgi:FixJ family two-component response regulator